MEAVSKITDTANFHGAGISGYCWISKTSNSRRNWTFIVVGTSSFSMEKLH